MTELETELWNVFEKNAKGNFLGLLKQIADIYDKQGILISVCATRKPEQDSESAQSAQSSQCFFFEGGKNIANQTFLQYFPRLSAEWENFSKATPAAPSLEDKRVSFPLLGEYPENQLPKQRKSLFREYCQRALAWKLHQRGLRIGRFPWKKFAEDSDNRLILPSCLPSGLPLKDPDSQKNEELKRFWSLFHQTEQSGVIGLQFTDEVFNIAQKDPAYSSSTSITLEDDLTSGKLTDDMEHASQSLELESKTPILNDNPCAQSDPDEDDSATRKLPDDAEHAQCDPDDVACDENVEDDVAYKRLGGIDGDDDLHDEDLHAKCDDAGDKIIKAPCEVESDPEARLAYLKTLCSDPRWILGLGILAKIHKEDLEGSTENSDPPWASWDWSNTELPSALSDSTEPTSLISWIQKKPYLDNPSLSTLERVFLALGLAIFNTRDNNDLWLNIVSLIITEVNTDGVYQELMSNKAGPQAAVRLGKRKRVDSESVGSSSSGVCAQCGVVPKNKKMHLRTCQTMKLTFTFLNEDIHRDPVSKVFKCPFCGHENKNSCKIRSHVNGCNKKNIGTI